MKIMIKVLIIIAVLIALYLLAIMPRMLHKPDKSAFKNWMYAHRGLHDNETDAPENSLKAFQKAVDAGFGIELDIQLTKDKIPIVFHDFTLERVCGQAGKVCEYTYEELKQFKLLNSEERIPCLEEVLRLVDGRVPLIVEIKIEWTDISICPIADKLLQNYKGSYCVESFNPLGIRWYRKNRPELMRGQLADVFGREGLNNGGKTKLIYFMIQNLLFNFLVKPDFVAYHHKYPHNLSRQICHRIYRNTAIAWTIKSQEELERARKNFDLFIFESFVPGR